MDEFPQFINILEGDVSAAGDKLIPGQTEKNVLSQ
ncbi:MAG: sugar transferase [Oscillospiraceae bacterium]|nr:sugar transferase [Oscillospiraceae bacterium]